MLRFPQSRRKALAALALAAFGTVFAMPALAETSASQFIEGLAKRAIAVIEDRSLSAEQRNQTLEALLREGLALKAIGRHVIGRKLKQATADQVAEYDRLFEEYSVRILLSRLDLLTGVRLLIVGERPDGPDGYAVTSRFESPDREPVRVLWRLRRYHDSFKVVDVHIENLSMADAQRSDFAALFQRHGRNMDAFLAEFRRKVESLRQQQV